MVLQRTFHGFPSGIPGFALLLLRFVVGGSTSIQAALLVADGSGVRDILIAALAIIVCLSLIVGFATPIAGALLGFAGLLLMVCPTISGHVPLFSSWVVRIYLVAMSVALVSLGPGAYSADGRLYGRREIKLNGTPTSNGS